MRYGDIGRTERLSTVTKASGTGECAVQEEDSSKHSQQHFLSSLSVQESSRIFSDEKRDDTRESSTVSIRGRKVSFKVLRSADMFLNRAAMRLLCVESPSPEKSSSRVFKYVN